MRAKKGEEEEEEQEELSSSLMLQKLNAGTGLSQPLFASRGRIRSAKFEKGKIIDGKLKNNEKISKMELKTRVACYLSSLVSFDLLGALNENKQMLKGVDRNITSVRKKELYE